MSTNCCNNFIECVDDEVGEYCGSCYSMKAGIKFETPFTGERMNPKTRQNKFFQMVFSAKPEMPWNVRQPLMDLFPSIERHFYKSDRINFIHMGQLIIEMLRIIGHSQYAVNFKGLKTVSRVKLVRIFVRDALSVNSVQMNLTAIEDLDYITPKLMYEPDMSKVPEGIHHIYSDKK